MLNIAPQNEVREQICTRARPPAIARPSLYAGRHGRVLRRPSQRRRDERSREAVSRAGHAHHARRGLHRVVHRRHRELGARLDLRGQLEGGFSSGLGY